MAATALLVSFKGVGFELVTTFQPVDVVGQEVARSFLPSLRSVRHNPANRISTGYHWAPRFICPHHGENDRVVGPAAFSCFTASGFVSKFLPQDLAKNPHALAALQV
jgi:hypothetical protein